MHSNPPPIKRAATMKVGAGQYMSRRVAMTMFPIIPPNLAATMETATPVALKLYVVRYYVDTCDDACLPQMCREYFSDQTVQGCIST